ncbi:MAG: DUF922 domain-containing protein [Rhodothermales bacterium]
MRASVVLFCCLLLTLAPHTARAQGNPFVQMAGVMDVYAGLPIVGSMLGRSALDRAGGGVSAVRAAEADLAWKAPARAPIALPTPELALSDGASLRPAATTLPVAEPVTDAVMESAATSVAGSVASAGIVRARSETTYYDVRGASREDLAAALRKHGPRIQGSRFFGLTEWEVSAEYRPAQAVAGCAISDLTVHIAVETHLPRWTPSGRASSDLHGAWDRFVTALDEHEEGHRALAEEAADTIRRRLASVRVAGCDQLDPVAQRAMMEVMNAYESRNLAYDAETGHGRTQGAVWPPSE